VEAESAPDGTETVLVVDDEEMVRELAREILECHGYRVLEASDGQEAVDVYAEKPDEIDLVLLDVTMPKLSGYEAMEQIRTIDPSARIVLASGYAVSSSRASASSGVRAVLQKPYNLDKLARTVRRVLDAP
jgi:two-component system cell cycle sensor histidine kinase/response regulator CckA